MTLTFNWMERADKAGCKWPACSCEVFGEPPCPMATEAEPEATPAPGGPAPATPIADGGAGAPEGTYKGRKWVNSGERNLERFERRNWSVK